MAVQAQSDAPFNAPLCPKCKTQAVVHGQTYACPSCDWIMPPGPGQIIASPAEVKALNELRAFDQRDLGRTKRKTANEKQSKLVHVLLKPQDMVDLIDVAKGRYLSEYCRAAILAQIAKDKKRDLRDGVGVIE